MASPRLNWGHSFYFGESSAQSAIGSASESSYYSPSEGIFALSPQPGDGKKRRKDIPSLVKHTFQPHYDGHLWRKYGQKKIKYAKLYYKCTYFGDKQCPASKQIQKLNEDELHVVTYMYGHTCGAPPVPLPDIVEEPQPAEARSEGELVLRFGSATSHSDELVRQQGQYHQSMPPSSFMMMSFGSMHYQQPFSHYDLGGGASSSFPIEALPAEPPSTNYGEKDDMFSPWDLDSFAYDFDDYINDADMY